MTADDALNPAPAFRMEREPAPPGVVLLVLGGEIDLATSGRFRDVVAEAVADGATALVLDIADVSFMDSTMLRELLRAHHDLTGADGRMVIAAAQPGVRRLLELTGTTGLFEMAESREQALGAVTPGG